MKRLITIFLAILSWLPQLQAVNLLGGEVTYENQGNSKYKIWVTIYRDCSECKLNGNGGGNNTKSCDGFDLLVYRSSKNTCSQSFLEKYNLTFSDYRKIIPVCSSTITTCDTGKAGFGYGVEAHRYYVEVDFDKYSSYAGCGFDLYVKSSDRADDIDNIKGTDPAFCTYSFIRPFEVHNSPVFNPNPELILAVNQPIRSTIAKIIQPGDSVVFRTGRPMSDIQQEIAYQSGYTQDRPLSVYCNGSSTCSPDPTAALPIGYYVNSKTGEIVFTPTQNSEKATLVFEVLTYRKKGTSMELISLIRRDIQTVTVFQGNNIPQLSLSQTDFHICAGERWDIELSATDAPYQFPDGQKGDQHTVSFDWDSDISGLNGNIKSSAQAPYNKLKFIWEPAGSDVRDAAYKIQVVTFDNHCPLLGRSTVQLNVYVHSAPEFTTKSKVLWCGGIESSVEIKSSDTIKNLVHHWSLNGSDLLTTGKYIDSLLETGIPGQYVSAYTVHSQYGCSTTKTDTIELTQADLNGLKLKLISDSSFCLGDVAHLKVGSPSTLLSIDWFNGGAHLKNGISYDPLLSSKSQFDDGLKVIATGKNGKLQCRNEYTVPLKINTGPEIKFTPDTGGYCTTSSIDLNNYVFPSGGIWAEVQKDFGPGSIVITDSIDRSAPALVCKSYQVTDPVKGCVSKDTLCIVVNSIPQMKMSPVSICNESGLFNLTNLISQPIDLNNYQIDWMLDGSPATYTFDNGKYWFDIASLTEGKHSIRCTMTNEYGCSETDTTYIKRINSLEIESNGVITLCQGLPDNLSDLLGIDPPGGIWSSWTNYDDISDNHINPDFCGSIDLIYTYDQYGCFASGSFTLNVKCKPDIQFNIPAEVCSAIDTIKLIANPDPGVFSGKNVSGKNLIVGDLLGKTLVNYQVHSDGCTYNYKNVIEIFPSPKYSHNLLPRVLCDSTPLVIPNLTVKEGTLYISSGTYQGEFKDLNVSNPVIPLTGRNYANGYINLSFDMYGKGACPSLHKDVLIPIKQSVSLKPKLPNYSGCEPYKFSPNFDVVKGSNDLSGTWIDWDYGDPASGALNHTHDVKPDHLYKKAGVYTLKLQTQTVDGCKFKDSFPSLIEVLPAPVLDFTTDPDEPVSIRLPKFHFINLSPTGQQITWLWDFGTGNSKDTSTEWEPTHYFIGYIDDYKVTLSATNQFGCSSSVTKTVSVVDDISLYIPNAFTPNGKGPEMTEVYHVQGNNVQSFHILIINRWGEVVFESNDINQSWDGKFHGVKCDVGVYAYRIEATSKTGGQYEYTGTLHILR
ncbi:MAG: T9SS type B sorting domain-containing protein [Bacteroidetes bacterium]|nr:T9SS type B sorting domain-containing protein [Bacteroidota bacterium]